MPGKLKAQRRRDNLGSFGIGMRPSWWRTPGEATVKRLATPRARAARLARRRQQRASRKVNRPT